LGLGNLSARQAGVCPDKNPGGQTAEGVKAKKTVVRDLFDFTLLSTPHALAISRLHRVGRRNSYFKNYAKHLTVIEF
jgi:hypothetical protein